MYKQSHRYVRALLERNALFQLAVLCYSPQHLLRFTHDPGLLTVAAPAAFPRPPPTPGPCTTPQVLSYALSMHGVVGDAAKIKTGSTGAAFRAEVAEATARATGAR